MNQVATPAMRHANASRLLHINLLGTSSILWLVCLLAAYSPTSPSYSPTSPGEPLLHVSALLVFDSVRSSRGFFHSLFVLTFQISVSWKFNFFHFLKA